MKISITEVKRTCVEQNELSFRYEELPTLSHEPKQSGEELISFDNSCPEGVLDGNRYQLID